jgi:hypothetical protein
MGKKISSPRENDFIRVLSQKKLDKFKFYGIMKDFKNYEKKKE